MDKDRKISLICSLISLVLYLILYLYPPPDVHYAPYAFSYNMTFFFPIIGLSLISAAASIFFLIKSKQIETPRKIWLMNILTFLPIAPVISQIIWMIFKITYTMIFVFLDFLRIPKASNFFIFFLPMIVIHILTAFIIFTVVIKIRKKANRKIHMVFCILISIVMTPFIVNFILKLLDILFGMIRYSFELLKKNF